MNKLYKLGITFITVAMLATIVIVMDVAKGQDTVPAGAVVKTIKIKVTPDDFVDYYEKHVTDNGFLNGPFDIIVFPSDKGENGMKYSNVPFIAQLGNLVVFPNGDRGKGGKPIFVMATGAIVRTK